MSGPTAFISPPVLRWARESVGYTVEEAAAGIGMSESKLRRAEDGAERLTLRQAEGAARFFEQPLAALLRPSPPEEEPQEAQFRRLPGAPIPPWPPDMAKLVRRVKDRQVAAASLLDMLGESADWPQARKILQVAKEEASSRSRELLGISLDEQMGWQARDGYRPLRAWIDAVEDLGILVMQDGHLSLDKMRGFVSLHSEVPVIVVNSKDDPRARIFTLIHELGHLYLAVTEQDQGDEEWLEAFAGQVLMPTVALARVLHDLTDLTGIRRVDRAALMFGVTPRALLTRAVREGLIPSADAGALFGLIRQRGEEGTRKPSSGDYYRNELSRLGPAYSRLVFDALDGQAVTFAAASGLLGIRVNNFEKFRAYLDQRVAPA